MEKINYYIKYFRSKSIRNGILTFSDDLLNTLKVYRFIKTNTIQEYLDIISNKYLMGDFEVKNYEKAIKININDLEVFAIEIQKDKSSFWNEETEIYLFIPFVSNENYLSIRENENDFKDLIKKELKEQKFI